MGKRKYSTKVTRSELEKMEFGGAPVEGFEVLSVAAVDFILRTQINNDPANKYATGAEILRKIKKEFEDRGNDDIHTRKSRSIYQDKTEVIITKDENTGKWTARNGG